MGREAANIKHFIICTYILHLFVQSRYEREYQHPYVLLLCCCSILWLNIMRLDHKKLHTNYFSLWTVSAFFFLSPIFCAITHVYKKNPIKVWLDVDILERLWVWHTRLFFYQTIPWKQRWTKSWQFEMYEYLIWYQQQK